jgi:hypothetical protein
MNHRALLVLVCLVAAATLLAPARARAIDFNLAGSVQLDYFFVPPRSNDLRPRQGALDAFTQELSLKLAVDVSPHVSANVKICYGCHGFEADMAYVDLRLADAFNIRVGRFNPTFGEFPLRHDPGNHRTSDKPLPYDMGRMLRLFDFNRSVLPSPYVDNGVEISGTHFFGRRVQIDYAAHAVTGMRAQSAAPYDVDFVSMRAPSPYVIDNNSVPSVGGRVGITVRLADRVDLSLGGSVLYGPYDNDARLSYTVLGGDFYLRAGRTNLRAEYLIRRTEMRTLGAQSRFQFTLPQRDGMIVDPLFFVKDGWYVELEQPLTRAVEVVLRWDGLRRIGNVEPGSALDFDAGISRVTLGANFIVHRGYRIKAQVQHWYFWGVNNGTTDQAVTAHLSVVATF